MATGVSKSMNRRRFLKVSGGGVAALAAGSTLFKMSDGLAQARVQSLRFTITDALKDMVTHEDPALNPKANVAQNYFWMFKEATLPPQVPGPLVFALEGDSIGITVTNGLDEPHEFAIPGIGFTTRPIAPGATFTGVIHVPAVSAGTYLYYDTLNAPVNRVMGLHGAFAVMPNPATGTPYNAADPAGPHPNVVKLFADLGAQPWFPGLAWDGSAVNPDPLPDTPPFRQYVWLLQEASPTLFADVGRFPPGRDFPAAVFVDRFLNNSFVPGDVNGPPAVRGDTPQFFTVSGQSGHFSHNHAFLNLFVRIGEPAIVRVLNAGLWNHCIHLHANHYYVLKLRNEQTGTSEFNPVGELDPAKVPGIEDNQIWVDTFSVRPLDVFEMLVPTIRPDDVPNALGIGRADLSDPLPVVRTPIEEFGSVVVNGELEAGPTPAGVSTWPPVQELHMFIPKVGTTLGPLLDAAGNVIADETPVHVRLSPQCFPMHDHSEPTQAPQGGNYNQGMIAGMFFIGDRNADGHLDAQASAVGDIIVAPGGSITFPDAPLRFHDPNFAQGDAAANERAVYGPDSNLSPQPPDGPQPPFEENM
jgi:Multicopper oxidase